MVVMGLQFFFFLSFSCIVSRNSILNAHFKSIFWKIICLYQKMKRRKTLIAWSEQECMSISCIQMNSEICQSNQSFWIWDQTTLRNWNSIEKKLLREPWKNLFLLRALFSIFKDIVLIFKGSFILRSQDTLFNNSMIKFLLFF